MFRKLSDLKSPSEPDIFQNLTLGAPVDVFMDLRIKGVVFVISLFPRPAFSPAPAYFLYGGDPGGALGYFLGGYVPPGTPNWRPVLKKISPKTDTPFQKWANFLYSVLESL